MIFFRKNSWILFLLCLLGLETKSQEPQVFQRNFIGVSITELLFTDFRISYERRFRPNHGIKLEFAYKPATTCFTDATNINLGQTPTGWCYRNTATWYYGSVGYRYYLNPKKTIYVSPELFFKTLGADKVIYSYGIGNGGSETLINVYELRTMHANMVGLNLLIGKRLRIKFNDGFHIGFDIFIGATVRYKDIHTTTYGSTTVYHAHDDGTTPLNIQLTDTPLEEGENKIQVSGQFGIVLYASWK